MSSSRKKEKKPSFRIGKTIFRFGHGKELSKELAKRDKKSFFPKDRNTEELAAIRIQCSFRRFKARRALRCLKGIKRLNALAISLPVKKQTTTTSCYVKSWNKLQAEIRYRRTFMVSEGRSRQKKQENQMKLEARLQDFEVEWSGGSESLDQALSRIHKREEAAVKRERAMAYAFSHQWRARPANQGPFAYQIGNGEWGWSWMDRWIAARPWEPRLQAGASLAKSGISKTGSKIGNTNQQSVFKYAGAVAAAVAPHKIASKTSMGRERSRVDDLSSKFVSKTSKARPEQQAAAQTA